MATHWEGDVTAGAEKDGSAAALAAVVVVVVVIVVVAAARWLAWRRVEVPAARVACAVRAVERSRAPAGADKAASAAHPAQTACTYFIGKREERLAMTAFLLLLER
jgi:hypothetical protein